MLYHKPPAKHFFYAARFIIGICLGLIGSGTTAQQTKALEDSLNYYYQKGDFQRSIFFAESALTEYEKIMVPGQETADYANAVGNVASLYTLAGHYAKALPIHERSVTLRKKIFKENSIEYANALRELAALYVELGDNTTAIGLFNKVLSIQKIVLNGDENNECAFTLGYLAYCNRALGNYAEAILLYKQAIRIDKKVLPDTDPDYAELLNNLSTVYQITGNYTGAEELLLESLAIKKKVLGEAHPKYANSLGNLATLYAGMGNYSAALDYYSKAIEISKKALGDQHQDYLKLLENKGRLYEKMQNYKDAEPIYTYITHTTRVTLGEQSPVYAASMINLARIYQYQATDSFSKAEALCRAAVEINRKVLGDEHPVYANALVIMGSLYYRKGLFDSAAVLFKQEIAIDKKMDMENNLEYIRSLNNLINVYLARQQYEQAEPLQLRVLELEAKQILTKLDFLSEKELLPYLKDREPFYTAQYASLLLHPTASLSAACYNNSLLFKGVSIQNINALLVQMKQSSDSAQVSLWKAYANNKLLLNKSLGMQAVKRTVNTDSLSTLTNAQEKELLRKSALVRDMKDRINVRWQDVQSKLKQDEAAIEFIRFNLFSVTPTDSIFYAALLVRKADSCPVVVRLFEEQQLQYALKHFAYKAQDVNRGEKSLNHNTSGSGLTADVYRLVWQPLEPYLTQIKTIYFSPEGILHQIAFAALTTSRTTLLCDRFNLIQLSSTREVVSFKKKQPPPTSIVLFGGIDYNKQYSENKSSMSPDPYAYVYRQHRGSDSSSFNYLPGTLQEVEDVGKIMKINHVKVSSYIGDKATEAAFRSIANITSTSVLHFATHGFCLPYTNRQKTSGTPFRLWQEPLLRSGLVLAGGNKGWKGESLPNEDDGILTALEISSIPLYRTQLVVLSACETGVGELHGSEGVFGLQRAFKMAGVNYVMASLWQVPDKETHEFMTTFYKQWFMTGNIQEAFLHTQQIMHKKYAPYYWAAFTLIR